jgi:hypothetical protein
MPPITITKLQEQEIEEKVDDLHGTASYWEDVIKEASQAQEAISNVIGKIKDGDGFQTDSEPFKRLLQLLQVAAHESEKIERDSVEQIRLRDVYRRSLLGEAHAAASASAICMALTGVMP